MSSRVQKGGTLFKPVVKARSKTAISRQPSVAQEHPNLDNVVIEAEASASASSRGLASNHGTSGDQRAVHPHTNYLDLEGSQLISSMASQPSLPPSSEQPSTPISHLSGPTPIIPGIRAFQNSANVSAMILPIPQIQRDPLIPLPTADFVQGSSSTTPNSKSAISLPAPGTTTNPPPLTIYNIGTAVDEDVSDETGELPPAESSSHTNKRRKVTRSEQNDNIVSAHESSASKKSKSRASSGTPRPRKRAPSPPPFDPDADPGEDIDPTAVTMASLCADTGQGRVSRKAAEILSNHAAWKVKNREKRARMRSMMEAKKYGRAEDDAEQENDPHSAALNENTPSTSEDALAPASATVADESGSGFDYTQNLTLSRYNVQVRIGANGETIIDEDSLIVDRAEHEETNEYTHITESDHTKFVNSGTYGKRYRGSRWSAEETELFYDALAQYGENYELIAYVLPGRDRKSCKNKFKAEDKRNPARINHCLNNSIPVDMKTLARVTGKDFSGPVPEIRAPPATLPPSTIPSTEEIERTTQDDRVRRNVQKRTRSKSAAESGVIILGDADNYAQ